MITCYTSGCCGDINHIDVNWAEPQGGFANAERMGIILAGAIMKAWPDLKPVGRPAPRRVKSCRCRFPAMITPTTSTRPGPSSRAIERPKAKHARVSWSVGLQGTRRRGPQGKPIEVEVQVSPWATNRLGLAAGRDLRRAGPGHQAGLALPAHHHRRAGQRLDRLHPPRAPTPRATTRS